MNATTSFRLTPKQISGLLRSSDDEPRASKILAESGRRRCSPGMMDLLARRALVCGGPAASRWCSSGGGGNRPLASLVLARRGHVTQPCHPSVVVAPQDLMLAAPDVECTQHHHRWGGLKAVHLGAPRGCLQLAVEKQAGFLSANTVDLLVRTQGGDQGRGITISTTADPLSTSPSMASFRPSHVGTPTEEEV